MRVQSELIYGILIFVLIFSAMLLSSILFNTQLSKSSLQYTYVSLNTITNHVKGMVRTDLILQSYKASQSAGLTSWNRGENPFWISAPYGCNYPPECDTAYNYLSQLIHNLSATSIIYMRISLDKLKPFHPYEVKFNISNFSVSLVDFCSEGIQNYYTYFYFNASEIYSEIKSPSAGGKVRIDLTINVTDTSALYLYDIASQWAKTELASKAILSDCLKYIQQNNININESYCTGEILPKSAAEYLEEYFNNPNIKCTESIQYLGNKGECPEICDMRRSIFCTVNIKCVDNKYKILYEGNLSPQAIVVPGVIYAAYDYNCGFIEGIYECKIIKVIDPNTGKRESASATCGPPTINKGCPCPPSGMSCDIADKKEYISGGKKIIEELAYVDIIKTTTCKILLIGVRCKSCCCPPPENALPTPDEVAKIAPDLCNPT